ncbi:molybdopterin-dependent oxidoreductase FAD-binding subunit [Dongshaea marina]|uniref:molybdopterin-dependent oxidoreductase FAD-binding subunit n=1 Tax=Dongshaea marina TaxID=2047966 RepID=UPI000D3E2029|nr:molybdopterin-dependent oxidoreductase FAD-binding subunit [Dongshaea marina]
MIKQYLKPRSVAEALALKAEHSEQAVFLGGGSKLNAALTQTSRETVIALDALELTGIEADGHSRRIGAMTRVQELCDSELIPDSLKQAAHFIYSRNLRNQATLGGEIVARQRESHLLPALIALNAKLELANGERLDIERYQQEHAGALIVAVHLDDIRRPLACQRVSQTVDGWSVLSAAVAVEPAGGYRMVLSGLEPQVLRLKEIEQMQIEGEALQQAVYRAVNPMSDVRGSESYKRYISGW